MDEVERNGNSCLMSLSVVDFLMSDDVVNLSVFAMTDVGCLSALRTGDGFASKLVHSLASGSLAQNIYLETLEEKV